MRSIEDQISEIRRRKSLYAAKKQVRRLSYLATVMGLLLIAVLMLAPGVKGTVGLTGSYLGATILGPEAGGYVIVALLSFALGILITIITQKYRNTNNLYGADVPGEEKEK